MPKARTRRDRAYQCEQWLREKFPTAFPVKVVWRKYCSGWDRSELKRMTKRERIPGIHAWCLKDGPKFTIALSSRVCSTIYESIDVLLHEWAHAVSFKYAKLEKLRVSEHDDEFFLTWGRIYRAWNEEGGAEDADKYKF